LTDQLRRRLLAGLILGFIVILVLVLVTDVSQVAGHLASFNWAWTPIILGSTFFNYLLRFIKWHYYLRLSGADRVPVQESARLFVGGFPLAVTPGKVGEALKAVWLERASGVPVARGVTVVLAERISDGLAVLMLSTLGVIAYPQYKLAFFTVLGLLLGGIVMVQIRPLALSVLRLAERLPLVKRFAHSLREFYEGAYTLFRPIPTIIAVGLGTIAWLGEGVAMYLVLVGLGIPTGVETFSIAVFVLSFSTVIGAVSTLPGGLGAAEASIAGMLTLLLSVSGSTAAAATLLIRFATLWFGVTLGLIVWAFSRRMLLLDKSNPPAKPLEVEA
jgi:uncharacterized protein (TIRG00374 family)